MSTNFPECNECYFLCKGNGETYNPCVDIELNKCVYFVTTNTLYSVAKLSNISFNQVIDTFVDNQKMKLTKKELKGLNYNGSK